MEKGILKKIADREGIDVDKKVDFEASEKGRDSKRKPNQEYVIIGIIYDKSWHGEQKIWKKYFIK